MAGKYEFWIGNRYVRSRSSNGFVSLISAISMLGITVAVAVLILVLSVVNGFERELQDRLLAMTAHASIEHAGGRLQDWRSWVEKAEEHVEVAAAAPFVTGQGLLVLRDRLSGVQFSGIDPQLESRVSSVDDAVISGDLASLQAGSFNIVLGVELADELRASIGDTCRRIRDAGRRRATNKTLHRVGYLSDRHV